VSDVTTRRIALMFPGQGAQFVGMGRELAESSAEAAEAWTEAEAVLGVDLRRICWEGPEEELTRTENAQPAILLHGWTAWRALPEEVRGAAVVAAGHSLGEFTAWCASGALSLSDGVRLVRRRGELMASSGDRRPGTMAAVIGLDPEDVAAVCRRVESGTVVPANLNAPGQVVISGDVEAVQQASALALEAGARRALPLSVSGAFHSPLMDVARDGLEDAVRGVELAQPAFPVVANATATEVTDPAEARRTLVAQLTSPVRWIECVATMGRRDPDLWLELGPGRVLSGLLKRIDRNCDAASVGSPDDVGDLREALDA
jgi:[acyl-carrier-protein] S-malonyltransferase